MPRSVSVVTASENLPKNGFTSNSRTKPRISMGKQSSSVTTRSRRTLMAKKDAPSHQTEHEYSCTRNCYVLLTDIMLERASGEIHTSLKDTKSPGDDDRTSATSKPADYTNSSHSESIPNITRRSKIRKPLSDDTNGGHANQHKALSRVQDERHQSIIELEDSCDSVIVTQSTRIGKSLGEIPVSSRTRRVTRHTLPRNDVTARQADESGMAESGNESTTTRPRPSAKKRSTCSTPCTVEPDASPPKLPRKAQLSAGEPTMDVNNTAPVDKGQKSDSPTTDVDVVTKENNVNEGNAEKRIDVELNTKTFETLIVSVKRIAPAMKEFDLKRLKYPEMEDRQRPESVLPQSIGEKSRQICNNRLASITNSPLQKEQPPVAVPVIEIVESPVAEQKPSVALLQRARLKNIKPTGPSKATMPCPLIVIEEESEQEGDVYDFSPSPSNTAKPKKRQKPRKPTVTKPSAKVPKKKQTAALSFARPATKLNPFGCSNNKLQRVIKNIGGGPVKQPTTVEYVVNLEIPPSPIKPQARDVEREVENIDSELNFTSPVVKRPKKLSIDRLMPNPGKPSLTSTPMNKSVFPETSALQPSNGSPWRVQDDVVISNTSYVGRDKHMLPSYDSFVVTDENVPVPNNAAPLITERRHKPKEKPMEESSPGTSMYDGILSEKQFRKVEQMYVELKATSEMSEKLITAIRKHKSRGLESIQERRKYETSMQQACRKLKLWYERSVKSLNNSIRIINHIQRVTDRAVASPSPLSFEQQRTVENFNQNSDHFRSMINELHAAINDSDAENRPPPAKATSGANGMNAVQRKSPKDVVILPERGPVATRNPLMSLNVVPLPQRNSPLMSPLAKSPVKVDASRKESPAKNNTRRLLEYGKDDISIVSVPELTEQENEPVHQLLADVGKEQESYKSADNASANTDKADGSKEACNDDLFGFIEDDGSLENSQPQVTLPIPFDISTNTLQARLQNVKQLLPQRPIVRQQQKPRGSGPTRCSARTLRMFRSPSKRPAHTLREFVASTPRPETAPGQPEASTNSMLMPLEAPPDLSAIEPNDKSEMGDQTNPAQEVELFGTPEQPIWKTRTAHNRTYGRIPRRKKKNVYLANLGLDDDDEDDDDDHVDEDYAISDAENDVGNRKKKNKPRAPRKPPVPVEQTKEFAQFVQEFNGMCESVQNYDLIIEK